MASFAGCNINTVVLFPDRHVATSPAQAGLRWEDIRATNAFGRRITGWLILPSGEPKATILISHGNAGNVGDFLPWAKMLADGGFAAAIYDYQGYGASEGDADVASLAGDGAAVVQWLGQPERGRVGVDHRMGLLGLSLGTMVSIRLARQMPDIVGAVVLDGSLIPGDELKRKFGVLGAPAAWLLCQQIPDELNTAGQVPHVRCPVLFVHSTSDEVTSIQGARDLFAVANEPKQWVQIDGVAHLRMLFDWPEDVPTVVGWFDSAFIAAAGAGALIDYVKTRRLIACTRAPLACRFAKPPDRLVSKTPARSPLAINRSGFQFNPKSEIRNRNSYRVWISEIMLQQTQVATALPYFRRFIRRFPTVQSLAAADLDDVLTLWAGLGYYSRANNLHRAAGIIANELAGRLPGSVEQLMRLPGIGRYTAGAIASIALNQPVPIVDGNVARVLGRLFALRAGASGTNSAAGTRRLWELATRLVDPHRPGDFNQGLMELGALVCTPAGPRCSQCPLAMLCRARTEGIVKAIPSARCVAFCVLKEHWAAAAIVWPSCGSDSGDRLMLTRRPEAGRWGGMWEFPGIEIVGRRSASAELGEWLQSRLGVRVSGLTRAGRVIHQLSHRTLTVDAFTARANPLGPTIGGGDVRIVASNGLSRLPVSRLTRKIAQLVRGRG